MEIVVHSTSDMDWKWNPASELIPSQVHKWTHGSSSSICGRLVNADIRLNCKNRFRIDAKYNFCPQNIFVWWDYVWLESPIFKLLKIFHKALLRKHAPRRLKHLQAALRPEQNLCTGLLCCFQHSNILNLKRFLWKLRWSRTLRYWNSRKTRVFRGEGTFVST